MSRSDSLHKFSATYKANHTLEGEQQIFLLIALHISVREHDLHLFLNVLLVYMYVCMHTHTHRRMQLIH